MVFTAEIPLPYRHGTMPCRQAASISRGPETSWKPA
jgi:hypothetical protein